MGHSSLIYKISCRQDPIINIVCSTFQNSTTEFSAAQQYQRLAGLYRGVVVTRRLAVQKFKKSSRLQEDKSNTIDYLFINIYSLKKLYYV